MRGKTSCSLMTETFNALDLLARDRNDVFPRTCGRGLHGLAEESKGAPTDLKSALRQSVGNEGSVRDQPTKARSRNKGAAS